MEDILKFIEYNQFDKLALITYLSSIRSLILIEKLAIKTKWKILYVVNHKASIPYFKTYFEDLIDVCSRKTVPFDYDTYDLIIINQAQNYDSDYTFRKILYIFTIYSEFHISRFNIKSSEVIELDKNSVLLIPESIEIGQVEVLINDHIEKKHNIVILDYERKYIPKNKNVISVKHSEILMLISDINVCIDFMKEKYLYRDTDSITKYNIGKIDYDVELEHMRSVKKGKYYKIDSLNEFKTNSDQVLKVLQYKLPDKFDNLIYKSYEKMDLYKVVVIIGLICYYRNHLSYKNKDDLDILFNFWNDLTYKRKSWNNFTDFVKKYKMSIQDLNKIFWGIDQISRRVMVKFKIRQIEYTSLSVKDIDIFRDILRENFGDTVFEVHNFNTYHHEKKYISKKYFFEYLVGIIYNKDTLYFAVKAKNKEISPHTLMNPLPEKYEFKRILNHKHSYQEPYKSSTIKTTIHQGQRKLFLSELEFLTIYLRDFTNGKIKQTVVIYAGAAHGDHIPFLSSLFPHIKFVLIDPSPFNITNSKQIEIVHKFFDDDMAAKYREKYAKYNILFISDIRSSENNVVTEDNIENDMINQMRWFKILNPYMALLKFKPRYFSGYTSNKFIDYLSGDIMFQVWEPSHSSETRLLVRKNPEIITYDCQIYENECYYFQNYIRPSVYDMKNLNIPYMDKCYDCCSESVIFANYLSIKEIATNWLGDTSVIYLNDYPESILDKVKELIEELTEILGKRMINIKYKNINGKIEFKEVLNALKKA